MNVIWHDGDGKPLPRCLNVARYSPDGFEWGYNGSGPAQLAVALLCDHFGNGKTAQERALRLHQLFKDKCIVNLPHDGWVLDGATLENIVRDIESQLGCPAQNTG